MLALLGDNGAGKSTLIKCLSGALRLDRGTIELDGRQVDDPLARRRPQASASRPSTRTSRCSTTSSPRDNFYAGRERATPTWLPRSIRVLKRREMTETTRRTLDRLQVVLDDHGTVGLISGGQRQAVAVARAAAFASRVVILDEPTAALGVRESRRVLDLILRLREEEKAVIVVSHAMDHVMEVADRAVVMRRGRKVGEVIPSAETLRADRRR